MLKHRLIFGILMSVIFIALAVADAHLDGSLTANLADDKPIQGTIFCILVFLLAIPANLELSKLASIKNLKILTPVTIIASILLAGHSYWIQFREFQAGIFLMFLLAFTLFCLFLFQYLYFGISGVLGNCGVSLLAILYLGILSSFCITIRIEFGLWPLLMYIFVVKFADIGAFTAGKLFGKHKFSPKISPGKTWEGMAGGITGSILVAIGFALICDIIAWYIAILFGLCLAFIGQLGDLMESMIKRDSEQKDSANKVPGFGGVLDGTIGAAETATDCAGI